MLVPLADHDLEALERLRHGRVRLLLAVCRDLLAQLARESAEVAAFGVGVAACKEGGDSGQFTFISE